MVDHRADLWAWGVSAYELLTFKKPFPGDSPDDVLRRQLDRSDFIPPRAINADIPVAVEQLILRCLEREMARRMTSTIRLVHELKQALYV